MLNLCEGCGKVYETKRDWQRFCNRKCSLMFYSRSNNLVLKEAKKCFGDLQLQVRANNFEEYRHSSFCYGWWRESYLYIGSTAIGFLRFRNHHVMNVEEMVQVQDELHLWLAPIEELGRLERYLIHSLKPKYNCINWRDYPQNLQVKEPIKRPIAPWCQLCKMPFHPVGRGNRRIYCEKCASHPKVKWLSQ